MAAVPIAAIALVVVLVPERSAIADTITTDEGPAQLADTHVYHLTAADRSKIDALLDRFIPAAVERRSAKTAWALSGPELHAYSSVAQWQRRQLSGAAVPGARDEVPLLDGRVRREERGALQHPAAPARGA